MWVSMFICVKRICFCDFLLFIFCRFKSFDYDRNDFFQYISFQKLQNRRIHQFSTKKKKFVSSFFINQKSFSYHDTANNRYVYKKKNHSHIFIYTKEKKKLFLCTQFFSLIKAMVITSYLLHIFLVFLWFTTDFLCCCYCSAFDKFQIKMNKNLS